jgi:hypothetical protein
VRGYIFSMPTATRVFADRRQGVDRRDLPRRLMVAGASLERRRVVDRRCGAERRSTLERRGRPLRDPSIESPAEHVRNALQLLGQMELAGEPVFDASVTRLRHALDLLETRR